MNAYKNPNSGSTLEKQIKQYLRSEVLSGLYRIRIARIFACTDTARPDEANEILQQLSRAHLYSCHYRHHRVIFRPWGSQQTWQQVLTEGDPRKCRDLPGNTACGHPGIWTIPTLTRAFTHCLSSEIIPKSQIIVLIKQARSICQELSAEDHYHFDQVSSGQPIDGSMERQMTIGNKMRLLCQELSRIIENSR